MALYLYIKYIARISLQIYLIVAMSQIKQVLQHLYEFYTKVENGTKPFMIFSDPGQRGPPPSYDSLADKRVSFKIRFGQYNKFLQ